MPTYQENNYTLSIPDPNQQVTHINFSGFGELSATSAAGIERESIVSGLEALNNSMTYYTFDFKGKAIGPRKRPQILE